MAEGVLCQMCGIEAPVRAVEFNQNIGMLIMRRTRRFKGNLCKKCLQKTFWKMSATTLFLGPWGTISLIVSPIYLVMNTVRYLGAIGMPAVPDGASVPVLNEQVVAKLEKYDAELARRLTQKEPIGEVARSVARLANVTPGQVVKYVAARSQQNRLEKSVGFPVLTPQQKLATGAIPLEPASGEVGDDGEAAAS